ncbi:tryptophan-rich sensory protein [Frigidibacter sp. RF13]|uniref:TspO/MBR family protein n=1 Tax=Frigidibacter sp. RF13 TaxID=2997340 RepID=UPI00226EC6FD|nr:TspO/MBR family protein [Frigidibacter sp. RF13]MCY1128345.1 tryptophan-rich sensory protein [Frigidibacter sp. RF13]
MAKQYHPALGLTVFLLLAVGGGLLIGISAAPGAWYAALSKPWFNPPNWLFGPVWTLLYILIAVVGWRSWRRTDAGAAMGLWYGQLALNFLWSPLFFVAHRIDAALAVITLLLAVILAFIAVTWRRDRTSALAFLPYALWVGFATLLNAAILSLNGPSG